MSSKIGMIGFGRMGANIVQRLLRGSHECVVFDRSRADYPRRGRAVTDSTAGGVGERREYSTAHSGSRGDEIGAENKAFQVLRYGLVLVTGWIALMKFSAYEAYGIQPLVAHSPLLSWTYHVWTVRQLAVGLAFVELSTALLIALRPWSRTVYDHELIGDSAANRPQCARPLSQQEESPFLEFSQAFCPPIRIWDEGVYRHNPEPLPVRVRSGYQCDRIERSRFQSTWWHRKSP
jgi:hypothetical protein